VRGETNSLAATPLLVRPSAVRERGDCSVLGIGGEGGLKPSRALAEVSSRVPKRLQRRRQRQRELDVGILMAPRQCCTEIADLGFGASEVSFVVSSCGGVDRCRCRGVVIAMTIAGVFRIVGFTEFLRCVLTHGLQESVAGPVGAVFGDDERLLDEQRELVEHLVALGRAGTSDCVRSVEIEPTDEDGQPPEHDSLGVGQECVRPVDRRSQGLLAAYRGAILP
jgi:hypothetical protein